MKLNCPVCDTPIPAAQMNVATDVGVCPQCNELFTLSDQLAAGRVVNEDFDIHAPPRGAWFVDHGFGSGWQLGATTRSYQAWFLIPFTLVWSGFSLTGIYGTQIWEGKFNPTLSLFGLPFLIGSVFLISAALMSIAGRVRLTMENDEVRLFTGVGPIGWMRRFEWSSIHSVDDDFAGWQTGGNMQGNQYVMAIVLRGPKKIKFGTMLSEERREYFVSALRTLLTPSPINK